MLPRPKRAIQNPPSVACIACREPIRPGAVVCRHCGKSQSRWRNSLSYYAGIGGLASLFAAALSFVVSNASDVRKAIAWKDEVQVFGYSEESGQITLANYGDGTVFVTRMRVMFSAPGHTSKFGRSFAIETLLEPGAVRNIKVGDGVQERFEYNSFPPNQHDALWAQMFAEGADRCLEPRIFYDNDPRLLEVKEYGVAKDIAGKVVVSHGDWLPKTSSMGQLLYRPIRKGGTEQTLAVPLTAVLATDTDRHRCSSVFKLTAPGYQELIIRREEGKK